MKISVQQADFDLSMEVNSMRKNEKVGAIASFVGVVREIAMTLEHYPGMTEKALRRIVDEAQSRWQVLDCTVIHRYGALQPTDQIVLVAVASAHRQDAFAACEFIMDYLKTQAPFWKKEQGKGWVEARASDDEAAGRWSAPEAKRDRKAG
jgi:molybdopterin synthase catalytic subunit